MRETPADLERLRQLLEDSIEQAGPFLSQSFEMPDHSLSAEQLVGVLAGPLTVALATVTARAEPRVAPIGAFFHRASFCVPTVAEAARTRQLARRPAASLTWFEDTRVAVIAHGDVEIIPTDHPEFAELDTIQTELGNESVQEWSAHGVYLRLHPRMLYTYARDPGEHPPGR